MFIWNSESYSNSSRPKLSFQLAHDKTYKICATSENADQPAHSRSLIRIVADRMCLLQPLDFPKRDEQEPLTFWVNVQADLSLC